MTQTQAAITALDVLGTAEAGGAKAKIQTGSTVASVAALYASQAEKHRGFKGASAARRAASCQSVADLLARLSKDGPEATDGPVITSAVSDKQLEHAERVGLPSFVRGFKGWLAQAEGLRGESGIDGAALAAGIAAVRAKAEAGFPAGVYLDLQGTSGFGTAPIWQDVLLAALAVRIGMADDAEPRHLATARRIGLA
ncbi:hypothetical protein DK419_12935 [Methylobacterium terrae]|uniref:Uncharacterized protein n=1 Tax=Methylobacterium terrae TaxID=2202827 RepID=A0A2U8WLH9_9HYPH|nr:hypothetical protein [Methylobacterium terrae]AWN47105.1 hypothetical protein DK419_12935 [Methylobacterium terrae]